MQFQANNKKLNNGEQISFEDVEQNYLDIKEYLEKLDYIDEFPFDRDYSDCIYCFKKLNTDRRIFDIASRMPSRFKVNEEQNKVAFRTAAAKVLPEEIALRKKLGFIVPIRIWMADERYNQDVQRLFHSDIAEKFFDVDAINAIFDEYVGGNSDNWRKVWTIYTFLVWYEEYFVKR